MKKLLLILGLMLAGAFVVTLVRKRSGSDPLPEDWSDSAAGLRSKATEAASKLSDSAKGAAAAVKEKAAEAKDVIKDKAHDATETVKGAAQNARS